MDKLRKCRRCNVYTLKPFCPNCNSPTSSPHPPRFSPEDVYGEYRRRLKLEHWRRKGGL